jgi:hypothetical protein
MSSLDRSTITRARASGASAAAAELPGGSAVSYREQRKDLQETLDTVGRHRRPI